jgi:hypothetical protein
MELEDLFHLKDRIRCQTVKHRAIRVFEGS